MQTFLSEPTFEESVAVIDPKRLNKQLFECRQILDAIIKTPEGGRQKVNGKYVFAANHPATNMYRGYEGFLIEYASFCAVELNRRDAAWQTHWFFIQSLVQDNPGAFTYKTIPDWWTDPVQKDKIMYTHRASLYRKNPEHYSQYKTDALTLDKYSEFFVCCPGKHAPYYYPAHMED